MLRVAPISLCSVALIVFGAGMMMGSATTARFRSISLEQYGIAASTQHLLDEAVNVSTGGELLVGVGAVVLGILALLGVQSLSLVLVGLLAVGFATMISGSTIGARMLAILRHRH
jgi:hypothetical protein